MSPPHRPPEPQPRPPLFDGPGSHADLARLLEAASPSWLGARLAEADVVAALPRFHDGDDGLLGVWRAALPPLQPAEIDAEEVLSRRLGRGWLGVTRNGFVGAPFPLTSRDDAPASPDTSPDIARMMRDLGYDRRQIEVGAAGADTVDDIRHRTAGVAGWLIANPEFLRARDAVRAAWRALPDGSRPPLPISRLPRLEQAPDGAARPRESRVTSFWWAFATFCDEWELLGVLTWDLPNVGGPKWAGIDPTRPETLRGGTFLETPRYFPITSGDGLEGVRELHRDAAAKGGFVDQGRWATYARLLAIDFWERVVRSRYADRPRPRGDVTRLLSLLSDLTGCDSERVKKLRRELKALRDGRRDSLSRSL